MSNLTAKLNSLDSSEILISNVPTAAKSLRVSLFPSLTQTTAAASFDLPATVRSLGAPDITPSLPVVAVAALDSTGKRLGNWTPRITTTQLETPQAGDLVTATGRLAYIGPNVALVVPSQTLGPLHVVKVG